MLESCFNLSTVNLFSPLPCSKKFRIRTDKQNKTKQTPKSPPDHVHGVRWVGSTASAGRCGTHFYVLPRSSLLQSRSEATRRPLGQALAPWGREPCSWFFPFAHIDQLYNVSLSRIPISTGTRNLCSFGSIGKGASPCALSSLLSNFQSAPCCGTLVSASLSGHVVSSSRASSEGRGCAYRPSQFLRKVRKSRLERKSLKT